MGAEPELRRPNRNKRGERTRADLLDAAWRLVDQMSLVDLLAGLSPGAVASEAGVTTGAFRHHFAGPAELIAAMIDHHVEVVDQHDLHAVADQVAAVRHFDAATVRAVAAEVWRRENSPDAERRRRRRVLLSLHSSEPTPVPGTTEPAVLVERFWRPYFELSGAIVDQTLLAMGRVPIPPFRTEDIVRLIRALFDGLMAQSALEPGAIDSSMYADALTGVLVTLTAPVGRGESLADLESNLREPRHAGDLADLERIQAWATSALGLFDRTLDELSFSQIASAIGVPIDVLVGTYGTVRRMAAISFVAVSPRVEESAERFLTTDPMRALADTLCDIARMAQQHPHVAAALVSERSEQAIAGPPHGEGCRAVLDVRVAVPITDGVVRVLDRLMGRQFLDADGLAADLVDLTLLYAGTRPSWAPAEVANRAIALLPPLPAI